MSEYLVVEKSDFPVTTSSLIEAFRALGVQPGMNLIVHSSLSALGWVCGGPVAVITALEEVLRVYGTLVMPTHSGDLTDPSGWSHPAVPKEWWDTIREEMPPYDPDLTPTRGMGIIPETFRKQADAVRSSHPTVSFAAWGEKAIEITGDHSLDNSLGENSPLGRMYKLDGWVLLLGVGFGSNTAFHLSEYRCEYPKREVIPCSSPVTVEGHRRWKRYEDINYDAGDFGKLGKAFLRDYKQAIKQGKIGRAKCFLFPFRTCVDYGVTWMARKRR
ncbi:MAG: aminoglycoside N(3)-acetyltransferase [Spirochaetia bacterium]